MPEVGNFKSYMRSGCLVPYWLKCAVVDASALQISLLKHLSSLTTTSTRQTAWRSHSNLGISRGASICRTNVVIVFDLTGNFCSAGTRTTCTFVYVFGFVVLACQKSRKNWHPDSAASRDSERLEYKTISHESVPLNWILWCSYVGGQSPQAWPSQGDTSRALVFSSRGQISSSATRDGRVKLTVGLGPEGKFTVAPT